MKDAADPSKSIKRVDNPPQRFSPQELEWLDLPPPVSLHIYEEQARSIISTNKSPDLGFRHSVNPYRGCFHACAYCYARPSHQYLDFGAGTDFESKLIVKSNAPELLRVALSKRSWPGATILFSGNTDCYQPLELRYELTQRCLNVCLEFANPVSIITKGAIIRRDIALLSALQQRAAVHVYFSVAFADDALAKAIEPGAPRPSVRFRAMQALAEAGIPVGIALAPLIPGLNDAHIPKLLQRAKDCGASSAFMTLLRLPQELQEIFPARLAAAFPERSQKVLAQLKDMRGGQLNRSQFGQRMGGSGARWEALHWLFESTCTRLGLNQPENADTADSAKHSPVSKSAASEVRPARILASTRQVRAAKTNAKPARAQQLELFSFCP